MAPLMEGNDQTTNGVNASTKPSFVVIGAGSRGNAYAQATVDSGLGTIAAVVEPVEFKRNLFGAKYIWQKGGAPQPGQAFADWNEFIHAEQQRRRDSSSHGIHGVFVCVRDELHMDVVTALAPLGLHMMCEKPLATNLADCLRMQRALQAHPDRIFAIGHVLRYSPHNMRLRQLVREERAIGDVLSVEHTEPVGWWHFSHSYVRGHWRRESFTAPSLLTKSCHDIDWLLWMLCSPVRRGGGVVAAAARPHLPSAITSLGSLKQFTRARKPAGAGAATNCLSCPLQQSCMYSAPRIYDDRHLARGITRWPVDIVNPELETILQTGGPDAARAALRHTLAEDYDAGRTPAKVIAGRPWFGRCVWESDNDVCDDQHVTLEWEEGAAERGERAKTASFHMIAQTLAQCERRGRIYGTTGEIVYDSRTITVFDFTDDSTRTEEPEVSSKSHHGGGDEGLTQQFVKAVAAVESGQMKVEDAQVEFLDVTLEEAIRSHAVVFAAEEARRDKKVVIWKDWWEKNMAST